MTPKDTSVVREGFPKPFPDTPVNVVDQFKMSNRVVVVNGAAEGIGASVAEGMAEAGAHVALWYNSNDAAIKKAEELAQKNGVKTKAYKVNVTNADSVKSTIDEVVKDFGQIDCFVANAGMGNSKGILDTSLEEYRQQVAVNVDGVVHCAKFVGEVFKKQGRGNLIITSSMSAHIVNVPLDQPVYNGTKAFVTQFGKCLAREWREFARVNIVSPGFFDTKLGAAPVVQNEAYRMAVLGRQGHTKEIKGLYLYLASDASSYTTGADMIIDGGYTLA